MQSSLYHPRIPVLDQIAELVPGRVIGANCLPATLAVMAHLADIRGYHAVVPARMVYLLKTAAGPGEEYHFAAVQRLTPKVTIQPPGLIQLAPS